MLVRKCDAEQASLLPKAEQAKLLAIISIDSLQNEDSIKQALKMANKLLEREHKRNRNGT